MPGADASAREATHMKEPAMKISRAVFTALGLAAAAALTAACSGKNADKGGHDGHAGHKAAQADGTAAKGRDALKKITASANYPLTTCVVSGDKLDAMDERSAFEYEGREVQFCCDGCIDEFLEEPAKFLAKLPAAAK